METDILVEHINALKNRITILCFVYDYSQHNRSTNSIVIKPSKIIIVEGILILQDERLRDMLDIKIYVKAD